jgi:hypothetical protein
MDEERSGQRWRLTVWFGSTGGYTVFDFDGEPRVSSATQVVSYYGEQEGRALRVNVTIAQVSAWSLEEISQ